MKRAQKKASDAETVLLNLVDAFRTLAQEIQDAKRQLRELGPGQYENCTVYQVPPTVVNVKVRQYRRRGYTAVRIKK